MEAMRAHVYTLKPTPEQSLLMAQTVGVVRLVYNLALEQRRIWGGKPYGGGQSRNFSASGISRELSDLRASFDWIKAVSQTAQNQALRDLDTAFSNFFAGRAGYPSPRKRGRNDAFRQVGREVLIRKLNAKWSEIRIPKMGWVRFRDTRPLRRREDGSLDIRNITVRLQAGVWRVAIMVRCDIEQQDAPNTAVGIDRGVAIPFAMSDGSAVHLPTSMEAREKTIKRAQQKLSRRKRGSKRYARARMRVAKLKSRNARARAHTAHVLSRQLVRSHGLIAIEKLNTKNMTKSAAGTLDEPGLNVAQKRGLNRSIQNVGWFQFETMLAYKLEETGGVLAKVPAAYSSQECSACGCVDKRSRESQARFVCTECGAVENADTNAAKVILKRALAGDDGEKQRWNTPVLDVEGNALAPDETSTPSVGLRLDAERSTPEIHLSSGGGRC